MAMNSPILDKIINPDDDLIEATEKFILTLDEREFQISMQRWGSGKYIQYEVIGKEYNLTRERIRQIIVKIKNKFINRNKKYFDNWRRFFLENLIKTPVPIGLNILELYKLKFSPNLYLGLYSEIFHEVPFQNFLPKSFEQLINRKIRNDLSWRKIIEFLNDSQFSFGQITLQKLRASLSNSGFNILEQLLCFKIIFGSNKFFFFKEESRYFLLKKGGIREITFSILAGSDEPLNFKNEA